MKRNRYSISLFSGAMGLDIGMESAGIKTAVALEKNNFAVQTILLNKGADVPVIDQPIEAVPTKWLLKQAGLRKGEAFVLIGGPCCQSFSTAGKRHSISDRKRGTLFRHFKRIVDETRPRFFVMENVKGMLSAAVRHRPLNKRGPGFPPLRRDEELGSALRMIRRELSGLGYHIVYGVVNCADYGVPQKRYRLLFIGSRDGEQIALPAPTHVKAGKGPKWINLRRALKGLVDPRPEYFPFSEDRLKFLRMLKAGQNWEDLPTRYQAEALGGAFNSWGGRAGFCRRLDWDKPCPTLTTDPRGRATTLCHPSKLRPLSIKEYARLQQFPDDWEFAGPLSAKYIQVGNAVPVGLGRAIGELLCRVAMKTDRYGLQRGARKRLGKVSSASPDLEKWLKSRRKTVLNPPKFRRFKGAEAMRKWMAKIAA